MNITTSLSPTHTQAKDLWLRAALLIDAAVTGVNGLVYIAASMLLTPLLGPPALVLIGIGVFLVCYAIAIALVGRARPVPAAGAWFAIVMNLAWTLASLAATFAVDWLTTMGRFWGMLQALVVLGFAVAQMIGMRQARS